MKNLFFTCLIVSVMILCCSTAWAQTIEKSLPSFEKIVISPMIEVELTEGEEESIRLEYNGIEADKINYEVKGNTLRIYLDDARITVKDRKYYRNGLRYHRPIYEGVQVKAYITYRKLRSLEVRGEERITCNSPLVGDNFRLKLYGESKVTLASLETDYLKAALYGENKLTILAGSTQKQRYRMYGENLIDTKNLSAQLISTSLFGESQLSLNASGQLRVTVLGESDIYNAGEARLSRRLVIGRANIQHSN